MHARTLKAWRTPGPVQRPDPGEDGAHFPVSKSGMERKAHDARCNFFGHGTTRVTRPDGTGKGGGV